ncbi:hypothetical protein [Angelakisella massiliensis]|uniref:hypothetical protein n=1 Tax=Angelakisella massiliensis TaxID=1871018 RepID=UPI0008F83102|nr:hypothetical protein [Angelakisella massiliensis]
MKRRIASLLLAITMTLTALPFASTEAEARVLLPPGESLSTRPSWERQFQDALNNLSMGFNSTTQQYDAGVRDLIQQNSENYNFTPYVGNSFSVFAKNAPQEDGAGQSYEGMNVYEVADAISPPGAFNSDFVEFLENELLYTAEGIAGPLLGDHNFINDFMQETGRPSNSYNLAMNEFADGFNQFYSIPLIKFGVDTVGIIGSSEEIMAGMIVRDLNHGSPLVQKVAAEWDNFLPTVSKLSTISEKVGYVGAVLDAYKYVGQISEGFSNNPFAGGGYEGLEFAVNALDGAMIGVALGGGPPGAIGALTYGIIRDRLDSDPVLVDVVKTLWDKTGFVGQIADAEVRIMNELLTPLLLEGMIAWDDLTGWEHFGVEDDANIAGYDHVQKMRELWYQKNQELAQLIREGKENTPEAQALIQWLLARQKWVKNDGPRAGHVDMKKPNIYLYPETKTEITVTFDRPELLTVSDPLYGDGWTVTAHPDGTLEDAGGKYGFLFYESLAVPSIFRLDEGFVVKAEQREQTYRRVLEAYGFNEQEILDFIEYWTDYLEPGVDYVMYPLLTEGVDAEMPVRFSVQPDNIFRLWFGFVRYEGGAVPEPEIVPMDRSGFEAVEWGGAVLN